MIASRRLFLHLLGSLSASVFIPGLVRGEGKAQSRRHQAAPSPSPDAEKVEDASPRRNAVARLRLWKTCDSPEQPLQIRLLPFGKPDSAATTPLKVEAESYQFSNYVEMLSGPMVAEISAPGHTTVNLSLPLAEGSQSTLLVRLIGTNLNAEWINDSPGPTDNGNEFCAYNLLPASGDIRVELGTFLSAHLSSVHGHLRLDGLKRSNYPIIINGIDGGGKNFHWDTEADFRQYRKVTLLLCLDAYGRIQPKVINT